MARAHRVLRRLDRGSRYRLGGSSGSKRPAVGVSAVTCRWISRSVSESARRAACAASWASAMIAAVICFGYLDSSG